MHASNDLSRETICELNLQAMATTMKQQKFKSLILTGVSMLAGVPLILPQRKRPSRITHWRGNEEIVFKGGTVVHGRKAFRGSEVPRIASSRHTPDQLILFHHSLTPLVSYPKVGIFGY